MIEQFMAGFLLMGMAFAIVQSFRTWMFDYREDIRRMKDDITFLERMMGKLHGVEFEKEERPDGSLVIKTRKVEK